MTPLEDLNYLKENKRRHWLDGDKSNECLDNIENALKQLQDIQENYCVCEKEAIKKLLALEIIKKKNVSIYWLKGCKDRAEYNDLADKQEQLTQEEYNLLKEVLKDE